MPAEVKLTGKSMEQRIADRLKTSGDPRAEIVTKQGEGPTRVFHHVHHSGHVVQPNTAAKAHDSPKHPENVASRVSGSAAAKVGEHDAD
jgi:hypothetical protein